MNKKLFFLFIISLLLLTESCQKCYRCTDRNYRLFCHKGEDTIYFEGRGVFLENAVSNLEKLNFICDTIDYIIVIGGSTAGRECDKADIIKWEQQGGHCRETD